MNKFDQTVLLLTKKNVEPDYLNDQEEILRDFFDFYARKSEFSLSTFCDDKNTQKPYSLGLKLLSLGGIGIVLLLLGVLLKTGVLVALVWPLVVVYGIVEACRWSKKHLDGFSQHNINLTVSRLLWIERYAKKPFEDILKISVGELIDNLNQTRLKESFYLQLQQYLDRYILAQNQDVSVSETNVVVECPKKNTISCQPTLKI